MFLEKPGRGTRDVGRDEVNTEFLDYYSVLLCSLFCRGNEFYVKVIPEWYARLAKFFRVPRPASHVPYLFPKNTSSRAIIHCLFDFLLSGSVRVVNDRLAVIVTVVMVILVHAKYFGTELGTDFAADAAIRVYSWYA